jgi:hypothetical protein
MKKLVGPNVKNIESPTKKSNISPVDNYNFNYLANTKKNSNEAQFNMNSLYESPILNNGLNIKKPSGIKKPANSDPFINNFNLSNINMSSPKI